MVEVRVQQVLVARVVTIMVVRGIVSGTSETSDVIPARGVIEWFSRVNI